MEEEEEGEEEALPCGDPRCTTRPRRSSTLISYGHRVRLDAAINRVAALISYGFAR